MKILLVVYDHEMYTNWFPMALGYIAAVAREAGCQVDIWNQDIHHYPDEALTDYLNRNTYDIVGINAIGGYWEYAKLKRLSQAINKSNNRPPRYIAGGHLVSPAPDYFKSEFGIDDICDIAAGENWFYHYLTDESNHYKHIDNVPFPAYGLFPVEIYRLVRFAHTKSTDFCMPILSSRGCPFKCNFCYRLNTKCQTRSSENIINEIKYLKNKWDINYFYFFDELLMTSEQRTIELCEAFLRSGLSFRWSCMGRLNYASSEVLESMKRAGCVFINYGIESVDDTVLANMNKKLTYDQIVWGIENTYAAGINPGLNMIWGNIGDTEKTLQKSVDFLLKYDNHTQLRTIRPVTPYPGSALYDLSIKKGKLKGIQDFYESKHTNSDLLTVNFTDLSDNDFYNALHKANDTLLSHFYSHLKNSAYESTKKLYQKKDVTFRGFRQT